MKIEEELKLNEDNIVNEVYDDIKYLIDNSRAYIYQTINIEMLNLYWNIGKRIMDIQNGHERAEYGKRVLKQVSEQLVQEYGRGFSVDNLERMRKFYNCYPKSATMLRNLSWSHYIELIKIKEDNIRNFYMQEAINSKWSVRELQRQIHSLLYERLALSKNKEELLEMANKGVVIRTGKDLVKDPFVLEFLDIKENTLYLESDLDFY